MTKIVNIKTRNLKNNEFVVKEKRKIIVYLGLVFLVVVTNINQTTY